MFVERGNMSWSMIDRSIVRSFRTFWNKEEGKKKNKERTRKRKKKEPEIKRRENYLPWDHGVGA